MIEIVTFKKLSTINTPPSLESNTSPSTKSNTIPSPIHSPLLKSPKIIGKQTQSVIHPLQL